ncbi:hypothetical protein [Dactylosporangium sp. CA-092794]|uniref:hypothetical protein n=1 Tax=Dactylosporangium sp. CA-092794 TaxID=3239929 RepID=UPI003D8C99C9
MRPDGLPIWVSEVEPGSPQDLTVAREHALGARLRCGGAGAADSGRPQHAAAVPALPRRTRPRPARTTLARPATRHRQPVQNRRPRESSARAHPFRAPLQRLNC